VTVDERGGGLLARQGGQATSERARATRARLGAGATAAGRSLGAGAWRVRCGVSQVRQPPQSLSMAGAWLQ
jgi:hypothetical protein